VLIPHTLPDHIHDLASETASAAGKPSIRRLSKSRADPAALPLARTRQEEVK